MNKVTSERALLDSLSFATKMHEGQTRKWSDTPYMTHPIAVANLVADYLDSKDYPTETVDYAVTVALLHDVVEDTESSIEDIEERYGKEIAKGVWFLTKVPNFVGNRAERKLLDQERLANAPEVVRIIKTFDMKHNSITIEDNDPKFWELFKSETKSLLAAMQTEYLFPEI